MAAINTPTGVAVDTVGNLYISEVNGARVRKVDRNTQIITTFAGTGTQGYSGDGGPATMADIGSPIKLAFDPDGNLLISDYFNLIRKVDAVTQNITTVAGIWDFGGFSGDGGPATMAQLHGPKGLTADSLGNFYVADSLSERIRKIDISTQIITTFAGTGNASFSGDGFAAVLAELNYPNAIDSDSSDSFYVADTFNARIRKIYTPELDDKDPCTVDECHAVTGEISHTPVDVDDRNPCTIDACNSETGDITHDADVGAPCSDGNACTTDEVCKENGTCGGGNLIPTDDGNPCTIDQCDPATGIVDHSSPAPAGTLCRAAAGVCDVAESCNGVSTTCPTNTFVSSSTTCRASVGICDAAERCTGSSATCPADSFAPSTTLCRASAGVCDVTERCTGSSPVCPANGYASSTFVCRTASGACDVAERCTGSSVTCPANGYASSTTVCRASAGPCDVAENCTGASAACPGNSYLPSTNVCRASTSFCDPAENCSGASASCPGNGFLANGTECLRLTGDCGSCQTGVCQGPFGPCDGMPN